jgi:oligoendopeptidase F
MARAEEKGAKMSSIPKRTEVEEKYRWKLEDLYPTLDDFEKDFARVEADLQAFAKCQGKLGRSAKDLRGCLDQLFDTAKRFARLATYSERLHDQDGKDVKGQELHDRIGKLGTRFSAATAFVEPEILAVPAQKMKAFRKQKVLTDVDHYLDNILRRRPHVLSKAEEEILARAGDLAQVPENIYETLSTVNLPFPEIDLDGQKVRINQAMFTRHRTHPDAAARKKVFEALFGTYRSFRETMAGLLSGAVSRDAFSAKSRRYASDLEAALDRTNVPTSIYHNMIKNVRANRELLWRYLRLKQKLLKVDKLAYSDLYASVVPAVEMKIPFEEAKRTILEALKPLGPEIIDILVSAFDKRWIDVYPTEGKRSGAYMSGSAYDVHPYILLNYVDSYDAMSTTAHELGHAVHSYLSNKNQKFHDADYPIFVAEVASTANENLLRLHLVAKESDRARKMFLLGQYLESWRTTVFRQCLFAEFELLIHDAAQQGKPLTADFLEESYRGLLRDYYGVAESVVEVDPLFGIEWAYIPHFYYNFYMFQYTTSFIASVAIGERIFAGDAKARDSYLAMLKAGGSLYPVDLLKLGGVDLTQDEAYRTAFASLERAIGELEKLADAGK